MANASRDANQIPAMIGVLNTSGTSTVAVKANPTNHGLKVNDNTTGSDNGPARALRDENQVPTLMAVSSADGTTPVTLYVDSSGNLLIKST